MTKRQRRRAGRGLGKAILSILAVSVVCGLGILSGGNGRSDMPHDRVTPVPAPTTGRSVNVSTLPPCTGEDHSSVLPCYWDAKRRGNGEGVPFWMDRNGDVHYIGADR